MRLSVLGNRLVLMWFLVGCGAQTPPPAEPIEATAIPLDAGPEVDTEPELPVHAEVTAFVLTKCPHAADAIKTMVALKKEMGEQLDVKIGYIGLVDSEGNIDPGIGEAEIASGVLQVCVSAASTEAAWFDYLDCVYGDNSWRKLPSEWQTCVEKAGIEVDSVQRCIDSGSGKILLAQAYGAATASRITASPTVFVNGFLYGQGWQTDIMRQYVCHVTGKKETRPALCDKVPLPKKIKATMVYDPRCAGLPMCDVEGEIAVLERLIPGFELSRIPFSKTEGRQLFEEVQQAEIKAQKLPLVVIEDGLHAQVALKDLLGEYLLPFKDGYVFALGGGWDPLAEICNNGEDDNENGKIDCEDNGCAKKRRCRESKARRLDLFAMSECPFALNLLPSVNQLLDHFGKANKKVDFNLQFIGNIGEDNALSSMHGQREVDEDKRMLCAQSLYRKNYKYMDYVLCRAEDIESLAWEKCVPKGMNAKRIAACASGKKGETLLRESFALAEDLGIKGSPTWLLNNKEEMEARRLGDMLKQYCARNSVEECEDAPSAEPVESPIKAAPAKCQ